MNFLLWRGCVLLIGLLAAPLVSFAQADAVVGTWLNQEKDGKILIYKCGDQFCGKLVQMNQPNGTDAKPLLDTKNPDARLRSVPLLKSVLMKNFHYAGNNLWERGMIYDGRTGKSYSCKMTLVTKNQLDVRGFVGFSLIGQTSTWTRVL